MQQSYAIEGGGFRGRTNKLVDGCYGWWLGGLFAVLESVLSVGEEREREREEVLDDDDDEGQTTGDEAWEENEGKEMLFNRAALQEYILIAAQHEKGGLRDKPGK
jgi:protein farnesyltransferase subunit beta